LWVLLPSLPLNIWSVKALTTIGNALSRFISVDEQSLGAPDRKLGRILVEIDIHLGLLETLDIQWRDQLFSQRMDYLGLPFRCTYCRKTGHLRSSCQGTVEEEEEENSRLRKMPRCDSPGMDSFAREVHHSETSDSLHFRALTHSQVNSKLYVPVFFILLRLGKS
jgi:hypothetical protein